MRLDRFRVIGSPFVRTFVFNAITCGEVMAETRLRVGKFDPDLKNWTVYQLPTLETECRNISAHQTTGDVWQAPRRTSKAIRLQFWTERQLASEHPN